MEFAIISSNCWTDSDAIEVEFCGWLSYITSFSLSVFLMVCVWLDLAASQLLIWFFSNAISSSLSSTTFMSMLTFFSSFVILSSFVSTPVTITDIIFECGIFSFERSEGELCSSITRFSLITIPPFYGLDICFQIFFTSLKDDISSNDWVFRERLRVFGRLPMSLRALKVFPWDVMISLDVLQKEKKMKGRDGSTGHAKLFTQDFQRNEFVELNFVYWFI